MIKEYYENGKKLFEVRVCVKDKDRKQHSKFKRAIKSERVAKEVEFQFKTELRELVDKVTTWTWERWHDECLKRMKMSFKQSTVVEYDGGLKKWLDKAWNSKPIHEFTTQDVYELIFEKNSNSTIHIKKKIRKKTGRIFELAVQEGLIGRNPATGVTVKVPKARKLVLSAKEASLFLKEAQRSEHRFYPIWLAALKTGMRSGELFALRWIDINFDLNQISVNKQFTSKDGLGLTKNRESRIVPISDDFRQTLQEWKLSGKAHQHSLWTWDDSSKSIKRNVEVKDLVLPHPREWWSGEQAKVTRTFCESLDITPIGFHDLRATFITDLLAQGVSLPKVMAIVGHKETSTTDEYLRLAGVDIKGATDSQGFKVPIAEAGGKVVNLFK